MNNDEKALTDCTRKLRGVIDRIHLPRKEAAQVVGSRINLVRGDLCNCPRAAAEVPPSVGGGRRRPLHNNFFPNRRAMPGSSSTTDSCKDTQRVSFSSESIRAQVDFKNAEGGRGRKGEGIDG